MGALAWFTGALDWLERSFGMGYESRVCGEYISVRILLL
jgi:hypothetical protein